MVLRTFAYKENTMNEDEVECNDCGWTGFASELHCSEEDNQSDKPVSQIAFNQCPRCGSTDVYDIDDDD